MQFIINPSPRQILDEGYKTLKAITDANSQAGLDYLREHHGPQAQPDIPYDPPPTGPGPFPEARRGVYAEGSLRKRRRFPWLMILGVLIAVPVLAFLAPAITGGGESYDRDGRPAIPTLQEAALVDAGLKPMTGHYLQRHSVAKANRRAYGQGFSVFLSRKPQIATCSYRIKGRPELYTYEFFYGAQPPRGYEALTRFVPTGHPLRALGAGAIEACPRTLGEAQDLLESFWSRLPPAPPSRNK